MYDVPRILRIQCLFNLFSCQVSHHFNDCISWSKTLWISILDHEVLYRGLLVHRSRAPLDSATAIQVESWVKCAFQLQKAYSTGASSEITRINTGLCVTWLKIIRARWCIVATSNTTQSRLLLIDLSDDMRICKEMQLPGPVLFGAVDDKHDRILLALTIGTT